MCLMPTNEQEEKGFSSCKKEDDSISSPPPQPTAKWITIPAAQLWSRLGLLRKDRKRGEEVYPARRKNPGLQLFPLAVTQSRSCSEPHSVAASCEQEPTPALPNPPQDLLGLCVPALDIQVILSKAASL